MQTLWLKTKPHSFQEKAHPKLSKVACTIHTHNHSLTTDESTVCIVFCCFHCLHQKLKTCMTIDKLLQNNLWFLSDFLAFNHCQRKQKVLQGLHTCDQTQNSWVNQWKIHNLSSAQCCKKIITQVVVKREKGIHSKPKNENGAFHLIFVLNQPMFETLSQWTCAIGFVNLHKFEVPFCSHQLCWQFVPLCCCCKQ